MGGGKGKSRSRVSRGGGGFIAEDAVKVQENAFFGWWATVAAAATSLWLLNHLFLRFLRSNI